MFPAAMRRVTLALALVAAGHLAYVAGSLDPITASTVFDFVTALLLGLSAWMIATGGVAAHYPRVLLLAFVLLAVVKPIDYLLSFEDGWQSYHVGWTLVAIGGLLLGAGAVGAMRGSFGSARRWIRYGAWASALGSADYAVLATISFARDGSGLLFLAGALAAGVGWAALALSATDAAAQPDVAAGQAPSP